MTQSSQFTLGFTLDAESSMSLVKLIMPCVCVCVCVCVVSQVQLFVTLWTVVHQASLSIEFSRQEYWSRSSFPTPGDLLDPGIEPMSPTQAGVFFITGATCEVETVANFIFLGSKITADSDGDHSHKIKRRFLLGRKAMTIYNSVLKSRGITLPMKSI